MRRKLPVLILAVVILMQVLSPAVFAVSKNKAESGTASFCSSGLTSEGAGKWTNGDGSIKWPSNSGFEGTPVTKTLKPGTVVDRYGGETGKFVSPQGTPYANRSLPPGSDKRSYNAYEILKPIDVQSGKIAPWFDQPGGGTQYQFTQSIEDLIQSEYLRRLP